MQDLDKFKNEMNLSGKNVYVGYRYVPKIMGDWNKTELYEPLSVVTYQGASYTSRQYVPTGVEITNEDFWALSGNYNAQVENYRQEVINVTKEVKTGLKNVNDEVVNARNGESTLDARLDKDKQEVKTGLKNVNDEVLNARNGELSLNARLGKDKQEVTERLAQKVGGGKLATMGDMGQDVKEAMTGGSVAVVGVGAVGMVNLNDELSAIINEWQSVLTNENQNWSVN